MSLLAGLNHIAIVTVNLDRFVEFYTRIFELETVFSETAPGFRHAILRISHDTWLHPAEVAGNPHGRARSALFDRGHLDHLALRAPNREVFMQLRQRLLECSATDGKVEDLGAFHAFWFEDPDGMRGEVTLLVRSDMQAIHAPRELEL
jgi:catechol 2,3-dioxygenase-like lactoylglutathione lyase family enzyme